MKRNKRQQEAALEAILFSMGNSVSLEKLAGALEADPEEIREILSRMNQAYEKENRGIRLIELDGSFQLCTKKEYYEELIRIAKQPKKIVLSDAVIETLSIIAYKQPVTKLEIEQIRGVKSDHAVNKLIEYKLVKELGRLDAPGKPLVFGTTEDFLKYFGLQNLEELPMINPALLADFKAEAEEEADEKR